MVQAPENSQNLNRYSYVLNNPMSYTDPSGYFFKSIGNFFKKYGRQLAAIAIAIAITAIAPQVGLTSFWSIVGTGAVAGYVSTGSLKGALIGAFTAGAFYGIGEYFQGLAHQNGLDAASQAADSIKTFDDFLDVYAQGATLTSAQQAGKIVAHGIAGGIMSKLSGSKFGFGFASAGVTQAFSGVIGDIGGGRRTFAATSGRIAAAAVLGGVASELSGGKFINGAVTGAFSRAFNDEYIHGKGSDGGKQCGRYARQCLFESLNDEQRESIETPAAIWSSVVTLPIPISEVITSFRNATLLKSILGIGPRATIQFGKGGNQIAHAFRHTDSLGLDRTLVQEVIESHFATVVHRVVAGKPFNQVIEIAGQRIQYTAYKISDNVFNIGRIHGAP